MNLKYRILWVEDDKEWVESEIEFIEDYLEKYGFILEYKNPEKYEKNDFSQFDIIVVDYNLANEEKGESVIEIIRKQELYTEILFYSIDGEDKLRGLVKDLDGIYCASKDSCRKKLEGLIKTTIRKTQDLNNLRGLVMAETSELDEMMKEILKLLAEKDKVEGDKIMKVEKKIFEWYEKNKKELKEYKLPDDFSKLVNSKHFTSFVSHTTLCSFSKCAKNNIEKKQIIPYGDEIIPLRNKLAHKNEFEKLKEADFINIRKDIQKYKEFFQKIIDDLNA